MSRFDRRKFLSGAIGVAAGVGSMGAGPTGFAATGEKAAMQYRVFNLHEADTLAAWCDLLAVGAADAGVAQYIDKNLSGPYAKSLLLLRYFQDAPLGDFYRAGIAGIDQESVSRFDKPFRELAAADRQTVVEAAVHSKTQAWPAPDANFFYFVSRSDAVDVVYGTEAGFHMLDIPYLAHIEPSRPW